MTPERTTAPGAPADVPAGATAKAGAPNVYQRKLAVMKRCGGIEPDKVHFQKFDYISIQHLSNSLREYLIAEGLDVTTGIVDGEVLVTLTNVDNPHDQIVSSWPVIEADKGWAYSVKYPLIRLFLVGDGEENDEAEMATKSGETATKTREGRGAPPSNPPSTAAPAHSSVTAELLGLLETALKDEDTAKATWTLLAKEGRPKGMGPTRWVPTLPVETQLRILAGLKGLAGEPTDNPYDPAEIPFP
jgi:hypothetical protein